jgi:FKBP-type peptidyl-prolyl cis-trans isomerase SlpA
VNPCAEQGTERSDPAARIETGARVTMHFSLSLADGAMIDSTFERKPASFTVGDGSLLPGFEAAIAGLHAGERLEISLPPEQAFGTGNPDNIQTLPRHKFRSLFAEGVIPPEAGTVLSFADGGGHEIPGVVVEVTEQNLKVDFNHPLAGRQILFTAEILSVLPAGVQAMEVR